ncbi:alpha-E domain-containing protein [Xanthobacter autotrophicus DSM 597]|uniref:alpha-E domain-containing protein n=1 Tax=Xanthobacter TaxID=279 RepID=UPI001AE1CDA7|nr:alpha-E domain-containing protein [Xanthobacter flavus]MBP2151625.1 putative alpha-E superfamily protein [Xanthobacter flavus]
MLSRTADNLYWLTRYVERADCLARILDVSQRLAYTPVTYGGSTNEWSSAVLTAGCADEFVARYGPLEEAKEENVVSFLAFETENPSSIRNCFEVARTNARSVRTALTSEMWDVINSAWIELRNFPNRPLTRDELSRFLAFVKETSLRFDGATFRTMLRNDGYWFARSGAQLERADNTARILDVKYHVLLPEKEHVGGPLDYFQWASILRSVSALTAFHWVYRDSVKPWLVADLLILNRQMPRSLAACYDSLARNLDDIASVYGRQGPSQRQARTMLARLTNKSIDDIFQTGLHEFISEFISDNNKLAAEITEQYLT